MITTHFPNDTTDASHATVAGLPQGTITWNSDFRATKDQNNKWSGSESFTVNCSDIIMFIPAIGSDCQHPGFSFMKISSVDVNNNEGNTYTCTCNFGGVTTDDDLDGSDDTNGTEYTSTSSTTTDLSANEYSYQFEENNATSGMGITTAEEPIETHPKFKSVSDEEMMIIQNVKSGTFTRTELESYTFKNSTDKTVGGKTYVVASENGIKLLEYVLKGVTSYLVPHQTFTKNYTSVNLPDVGLVGTIQKPPGGVAGAGGEKDWIFGGVTATKQGHIYNIQKEWIKSAPGGWDEYLYKKA